MTREEQRHLKIKTENIQKLIQDVFKGDKVICLSSSSVNGTPYCEWAVISGMTKHCIAVFSTATTVFQIQFVHAIAVSQIPLIDAYLKGYLS